MLPYALCNYPNLVKNVSFNEKTAVYVPKKSLLFLYNLKAFRDRAFDLKTRGAIMSVERRQWMRTKLEKDGADLIALLDPNPERYVIKEELDLHLLKQLIEKHDPYFALETIKELPFIKKSVERYAGIGQNTIRKGVQIFL